MASSASKIVTSFRFAEIVPVTSGGTSMLYRVPDTRGMKNCAAGKLLKARLKRCSTGWRGPGASIFKGGSSEADTAAGDAARTCASETILLISVLIRSLVLRVGEDVEHPSKERIAVISIIFFIFFIYLYCRRKSDKEAARFALECFSIPGKRFSVCVLFLSCSTTSGSAIFATRASPNLSPTLYA